MSFRQNITRTYTAQIVSVVSSFLCSIMAARMLGNYGQGELALYTNFISFGVLLIGFGLPASIVHFIASGKLEKKKLFSILAVIVIIGFLLLYLLLLLSTAFSFLTAVLPEAVCTFASWFWVLFLPLLFLIINTFMIAVLQAEGRFSRASYIAISGSLLLLALYSIKYFKIAGIHIIDLEWIIFSMAGINLIQLLLYLREVYHIDKSYFHFGPIHVSSITPLLQFAGIAFATNLIQFLSYKMDIWFVNYYHGKAATGVYALGASLSQMLWLLPTAVQAVLYASLSSGHNRVQNISKTVTVTKQLGLYALGAGIFGGIASYFLVPFLFGSAFNESVQVIWILLIGIIPFCLSMAVSAYFAASGRVIINFYSAVIGFLLCLIADIILIPTYGIIGAAAASVISYISTVAYLLFKFQQEKAKVNSLDLNK